MLPKVIIKNISLMHALVIQYIYFLMKAMQVGDSSAISGAQKTKITY